MTTLEKKDAKIRSQPDDYVDPARYRGQKKKRPTSKRKPRDNKKAPLQSQVYEPKEAAHYPEAEQLHLANQLRYSTSVISRGLGVVSEEIIP